MSEVYIKEPSTKGKAIFQTTHGDLEVELWATEAPLACRNFCQLILEGHYNGTIFHRVIKDFIIQGGDKTNTGDGCESIYDKPYADEIHPRLKFRYRGMMGVASAGKGTKTNGSQFFIVLNRAPSLDGKHTLFGKIVGQTVYNLVKIADVPVDKQDRPIEDPPRIIRSELVWDPFGDLEPRQNIPAAMTIGALGDQEPQRKSRAPVHNKKVLSFGDEGDDEDDDGGARKAAKGKSAHDLLNDPKLSREAAYPDSKRAEPSAGSGGKKRSSEQTQEEDAPKKAAVEASTRQPAAAKRKPRAPEAAASASSSDEDSADDNVATQKSSKRAAEIAKLKRDIAGMAGGEEKTEKKKKAKSYLQQQREGYTTRARNKAETRTAKKKEAEEMMNKLKKFQDRVRDLTKGDAGDDDAEKDRAMKATGPKPKAEEGTFAAIWQEGDDEIDGDWLDGHGLKFQASADKAFKLRTDKEKSRLEIFDPLAAAGNKELIANEQKNRSKMMVPQKVKRPDPKIAHPASAKERL